MPISRVRVPVNPVQLENINTLIKLSEQIEEQRYESATQDVQVDVEDAIEGEDLWLVKYDELSQKTRSIPLSHLGCCKEGGELFSSLCMWVDVNQRYVDLGLFPQWYDIARELNIDELKTEWVKVCIRPEQSFTRAILEIYMYDGGTLGEVISALRKQQQYRIIQEISEKADVFLDVYTVYHKNNYDPTVTNTNHLYSIMHTLFDTFSKTGYEDPLGKFQDYSQGFKNYFDQDTAGRPKIQAQTEYVVNAVQLNNGHSSLIAQDSGYTSPRSYSGYLPAMPPLDITMNSVTSFRDEGKKAKVSLVHQDSTDNHTVRILLVFAMDGVGVAEDLVEYSQFLSVPDIPDIQVDIFRLNEMDLWNAILQNPEACILKWLDEMDFIMPILSPELFKDLHQAGDTGGPPAPTSPLINKYIYSLLRTQFVSNGCKNLKVRPLLPVQFESSIGKSKPLTSEPLFRMWNYTDRESFLKRLNAMVKLWAKNNGHLN